MTPRARLILLLAVVLLAAGMAVAIGLFARSRVQQRQDAAGWQARRHAILLAATAEDAARIPTGPLPTHHLQDLPVRPGIPGDWAPVELAGAQLWLPAGAQARPSSTPMGRPRLTVAWPERDGQIYLDWRPEDRNPDNPASLLGALQNAKLSYQDLMAGHASELEALLHHYALTTDDLEMAPDTDWEQVFRRIYLKDLRLPPRLHLITPEHHLLLKHAADRDWAMVEVFDSEGVVQGQLYLGVPEGQRPLDERLLDPLVLARIIEGPSPVTRPSAN